MSNNGFRWNKWNFEHIGADRVTSDAAEYVADHANAPYPKQIGDDRWRVCGDRRRRGGIYRSPRKSNTQFEALVVHAVTELLEVVQRVDLDNPDDSLKRC